MNRVLTTFVFFLLVPLSSFAQAIPSPSGMWCQYCKPKETVIGPIRSLLFVEKREEYPFDTIVETYAFGRKVESLAHSSSREVHSGQIVRLDSKTVYNYDAKGRLRKEVRYSLEKPGESYEVVKYQYSDEGRLVEELILNGDGTPFLRAGFSYDTAKNTVTALTTSYVDGRVIPPFKAVLIYNERDNGSRKACSERMVRPTALLNSPTTRGATYPKKLGTTMTGHIFMRTCSPTSTIQEETGLNA